MISICEGEKMTELCLGTAQLGMKYGINNKVGKIDKKTAFEILNTAVNGGITVIDTASIYGEAEMFLGEYFNVNREKTKNIKIISKQCNDITGKEYNEIEKVICLELEKTLKHLNRDSIDGYLLHLYDEIRNPYPLLVLNKLKREGIIKKIGVSVYEVEEAKQAIETGIIDYLQMPYSIFDQRARTNGIFDAAAKRGITIFTRSAFLQGLLLVDIEKIPTSLYAIKPYLLKFESLLKNYGIEKKHAIIKYVLSERKIDYMVFGVETREQLLEILKEKDSEPLPDAFISELNTKFSEIPKRLILPIFWDN